LTLSEKIALQKNTHARIFLFKEGLFYKVYNEGAYFLRTKKYKVHVKKINRGTTEILSIGFPSSVFENLKEDYLITESGQYSFFETAEVFDVAAFERWKNEALSTYYNEIGKGAYNDVLDEIKKYPLATKTPMEAFLWICEIQKRIGNEF